MRRYRIALFMLCIALLGALPFIISLPKPDTAGDQRESTVQGQTDIQRKMAARRAADPIVATQIERTFQQSGELSEAGKYKEALAALDKLQAFPDKTVKTVLMDTNIDSLRQFLLF